MLLTNNFKSRGVGNLLLGALRNLYRRYIIWKSLGLWSGNASSSWFDKKSFHDVYTGEATLNVISVLH